MRLSQFLLFAVLAVLLGCQSKVPAHNNTDKSTLSPAAALGKQIFFDPSLSASGKLSCATCHSPAFAYGPSNGRAVQLGGATLTVPGLRAVPSLRYTLAHTPIWSHPRPTSLAEQVVETDGGPAGGFTWDGRFNTLHEQAAFPLLNGTEMASSKASVLAAIARSPYASDFRRTFGADVLESANLDRAFASALAAIERFELEDPSFHPYNSKYDQYLDSKAQLSAAELRGLALFNDPNRGNCAGCHLSQRGADGSHPLFTDYQFEAIGVPRNAEIPANRNKDFYDLGLCGPIRIDQQAQNYCGMFKTPTLRNVATRQSFFHNGRFHTLREALRFYSERDTNAAKWYAHNGRDKFDDIPASMRSNVDTVTAPLTHRAGQKPVWTDIEIDDVIAFLSTLTDADAAQRQ